jgi:hypothetical protein
MDKSRQLDFKTITYYILVRVVVNIYYNVLQLQI